MRRFTSNLDEALLERARRVLGTRGVSDTLNAAMREVVQRARREELRRSFGTWDLDLTPERLSQLRHGR